MGHHHHLQRPQTINHPRPPTDLSNAGTTPITRVRNEKRTRRKSIHIAEEHHRVAVEQTQGTEVLVVGVVAAATKEEPTAAAGRYCCKSK